MTTAQLINGFLALQRRSEKASPDILRKTFVDVGPLLASLSINDNQALFGRRGTGKTHVLQYLASTRKEIGDVGVYIDLSNLGSSGSIYADSTKSLSERATRLLVDMVIAIHNGLLEAVLADGVSYDLSILGPALDTLAHAATQIRVQGTVEEEVQTAFETTGNSSIKLAPAISDKGFSFGEMGESSTEVSKEQVRSKSSGVPSYVIHFGEMAHALQDLEKILPGRLWVLLDEWSNLPIELQPFLADLLRRTLFVRQQITVKIAAIEFRSKFAIKGARGSYVGVELGADVAPSVNLDDFMVFDNDDHRAAQFHKELLRNHLLAGPSAEHGVPQVDELIKLGFSQENVFSELVRAGEGVPRDFINILAKAAMFSNNERITMALIRKAALSWYQEGKASALRANDEATRLLDWICDQVIKHRKTRAFLVRTHTELPLLDELFDSRVLHLIKRSVSSNDQPGKRFDVFKLDYGCYVDLNSTAAATEGLFVVEGDDGKEEFVQVPRDDYRSIRRAILDIEEFERQSPGELIAPAPMTASSK